MLFEEYNVDTAIQVKVEETNETIATQLLKIGDSVEKVQLVTGLPTEHILELKNQLMDKKNIHSL